jgi:predicted flap endonuclease-1-like 5' DNA nuclease
MLPLISVLTQFLLVTLVVTAAVLGIAVGYFYVQARRAEREAPSLPPPERAELRQRDAEIAVIRMRIEEISRRQQTGNETQHQIVQQQLEQIQQHLKARARQIEGFQSQLRYEMRQRDEAMAQLGARLEEAIHTDALAAARALPQATAEPTPALPGAQPEPSLKPEASAEPEIPARPPSLQPQPAVEPPAPEPAEAPEPGWSWEPIELDFRLDVDDPEKTAFPTSGDGRAGASQGDLLALFGIGDGEREGRDEEPTPVYFPVSDLLVDEAEEEVGEGDLDDTLAAMLQDVRPEPTPVPTPVAGATPEAETHSLPTEDDALDGLVQWALLDLPTAEGQEPAAPVQAQAVAPAPSVQKPYSGGDGMATEAKPAVPPGAEALTILPAVDDARQAVLYRLGVRTIEDVARWSRMDARRIAAALEGVSEDDIMNDWVFEAQSILFDRYQRDLGGRRTSA